MTRIDPLLLAIARAGLPGAAPPPGEAWADHLDDLMARGLAGLFSASAAAGMIDIDAQMAGRLQRQLDAEAVRAVQLEGELIRLAPALEHLGAVILKGAVLAHAAYPDPLLRPFTDLDVLVPGNLVDHAVSVFATYGYERARPEPAPGYDARVGKAVTLRHPGGVVVDLHRTLAAGAAADGIDVGELVAARRPVRVGSHTVPAPSWEAHLIECTLHAVVGDGLARPLSLRDIAEVIHHPSFDPTQAAELALRWHVAELVGMGLRAARDGLGLELPNALAALAHRADLTVSASEPARSARIRLDELRSGDLRRRATLARSLVAPSAEFLRWAHGDAPLPHLYGRRWRSLYQRAMDARRGDPPDADDLGAAVAPDEVPTAVPETPGPSAPVAGPGRPVAPVAPESGRAGPPGRIDGEQRSAGPSRSLTRWTGTLERPAPVSRQEAWSRARPPRQGPSTNGNGRSPHGSTGGGHSRDGPGGGDDDGSGPPGGPAPSAHHPTRGAAPGAPSRNGLALGVSGGALLVITALGSQLGNNSLGVVLVPLAGLLLAGAASRRIARLHPDEAWVGRWLVLAVVVKLVASYVRYQTITNDYGGIADATGYDQYGRRFAAAWLEGGNAPDLTDLRQTNFIRWFTGVVYYVFGANMVAGFFLFGLLALVGSYLWYRATADAVPQVDKRVYLALVLFAPSVAFWPSSIGKESLMQLGIGAVALATAYLLRQRLARAAVIGLAGGWLLWVVRPHLLALVTLASGCAYIGGRVRANTGAIRSLLARPVGLLAVAFLVAFTISQGAKFLGIEDLSLSSIEAELNEQTERSSQGGSQFDNGDNSLNPVNLPRGAVTVLLRPFPWETDSPLQLLSSLESAILAGIIVVRFASVRAALALARSSPFLLYCWVLLILYAATFASFANFGLLVRQRSLVLPALFAIIAVRANSRPAASPGSMRSPPVAVAGGARAGR